MNQHENNPHSQKQTGQGMVEYAILLMLIAAAIVLSLTSVGEEIANVFRKIRWGNDEAITELVTVSVLDAQQNGIGGVRVFAYTGEGDYLELYKDTDADGNVTFDLDNGRFQFLAQHQLQYYWSPAINRPGQNHANILTRQAPFTVNVLDTSGNGVGEIPVYVFTEEEEYTGITGKTDKDGILKLDLVESTIKFRVDADGNAQWTEAVPTSDEEITITLNPCGTNQYLAEYFNNRNLTDAPVFTRCEPTINNSWAGGGPGNGLNNDNFSVRWTGQFQFKEDTYAFRTTADDGVRVWLDNKNITDAWKPQSATTYESRQQMKAGLHNVKMEYYEAYGNATAQLRWDSVIDSCPTGQFMAEYFNNTSLSGDPVVVQCENSINNNWGYNAPVNGIGSNNFSVRWSGQFQFGADNYHFTATGDDGLRVWIDDQQIISAWQPQPATTYASLEALTAGTHTITMEYYQQGGAAVAILNWKEAVTTCPTGYFMGEYFNNKNLSGDPVLVRCDKSINFSWGNNSPTDSISADNFSVRWQGEFTLAGGETTFTATSDDGIQLFIDNDLLISAWYPQSSIQHKVVTELTPGSHKITVNYYESTGAAVARVNWD